MPKLTHDRIIFLNKQLKKQHVALSSSYLQIQEIMKKVDSDEEPTTTYKLVRRIRDTDSVLPEFDSTTRDLNIKNSLDLICEEEERSTLSGAALIEYKATLQQQIRAELTEANLELYYKELGARPSLSPYSNSTALIRTAFFFAAVASILLSMLSPFTLIALPFALLGLFKGPEIINHFMKKRFDKKSAGTQQDPELTAELDQLCETYCVDHEIAPWTVDTVAKGDNEDQLFNIARPARVQWTEPLNPRENSNEIDQIDASVRATIAASPHA